MVAVDESLRLPFDEYDLREDQLTEMQRATIRLVDRCMTERGVTTTIVGDFVRPRSVEGVLWGGPLGTLPLQQAQQYGYHASPTSSFAFGPGFYTRTVNNISPESGDLAVQANFYGRDAVRNAEGGKNYPAPHTGCVDQVEHDLHSPLVLLTRKDADAANLAYNDPRVQRIIGSWSRCMGKQGFAYRSVTEPTQEFLLTRLTEREVAVAVADVGCTASSGWARIYYAVLRGYQHEMIDADPDLFAASLKALQRRQDRLATVGLS